MKTYKRVLVIAGSDSGGGAGIQADIKAISACGAYAATAITAITAQNTMGVQDVFPLPVAIIEKQIHSVMEDIGADAIKIGMLHSEEVIRIISESLKKYENIPIVLDPVMVSTSGHALMEKEAIQSLKEILIPMATVITPNIPEAEILLDEKINDNASLLKYAEKLALRWNVSVWLKAGHFNEDELVDVFFDVASGNNIQLKTLRHETKNTHGTGCTLASALSAFLARGFKMEEAVREAKKYLDEALLAAMDYKIGNGFGPVHHFYKFW